MYVYRLTRRGRFVVSMFLITIFITTGMLTIKTNAKDNVTVNDNYENISSSIEPNTSMEISRSTERSAISTTQNSSTELFLSVDAEKAYDTGTKKTAFLTFDDGPSYNITPQVLDVLDEYDIKATFFILGSLAVKNPDILKEINEGGHAIGNHSYSHNYKSLYASVDSFIKEINDTDAELKEVLGSGFHTRLFRFPGGSFGDIKDRYKDAVKNNGYAYVDWNVVIGDGESSAFTPEQLIERLKSTANGKQNLVVLMHDSAAKQTTVQALPEIIKYLKQEGYQFASLK